MIYKIEDALFRLFSRISKELRRQNLIIYFQSLRYVKKQPKLRMYLHCFYIIVNLSKESLLALWKTD